VCGDRTDSEILNAVGRLEGEAEDENSEEEVELMEINHPPPPDILLCVDMMRNWMVSAAVDESVHALLSSIENAVFAEKMRKRRQTKISDYFKHV